MKIKLFLCRTAFFLLSASLFIVSGCSKKETSTATTSSSDNSTPTFAVSEINQTLEDGYYAGSFVVPSDGVSFILSVFKGK